MCRQAARCLDHANHAVELARTLVKRAGRNAVQMEWLAGYLALRGELRIETHDLAGADQDYAEVVELARETLTKGASTHTLQVILGAALARFGRLCAPCGRRRHG